MQQRDLCAFVVERRAESDPSGVLVRAAGGATLTNAEFHVRTLCWSDALARAGAGVGDRIGLMLPTGIEAFLVQQGAAWAGCAAVAFNVQLRGGLLSRALTLTSPRVLVTTGSYLTELVAIEEALPADLATIIVLDDDAATDSPDIPGRTVLAARELLDAAQPRGIRRPRLDDAQGIIFTSGTTGPSKAVQLSHEFFTATAQALIPGGADARGGAYYSPWPIAHSLGSLALAGAVSRGVPLVVRAKFTVQDFWRDVRDFDCRSVVLVSVGASIWNAPPQPADAESPLRYVAMAPLIPQLLAFSKRFGVQVSSMYGMTEIGPALMDPAPRDHRLAGLPVNGYEVQVVGSDGVPLAADEPGELVIRHTQSRRAMDGYLDMVEHTKDAWRDGWFHTGDLFVCEPSGQYRYVDRLKDCIRRHGRNISSYEIETAANAHPAVTQCAAVGVRTNPSDDAGVSDEEVKLFVVINPATKLLPVELSTYLRDRLPRFMVPRFVEFIDAMPTGTTGRPNKTVLRDYPNTAHTFDRYAFA